MMNPDAPKPKTTSFKNGKHLCQSSRLHNTVGKNTTSPLSQTQTKAARICSTRAGTPLLGHLEDAQINKDNVKQKKEIAQDLPNMQIEIEVPTSACDS